MSTISAGTTSGTALVNAGDTTGALQLQVNGTTPSVTLAANGSIGVGSTPAYGTAGQVLTSAGSAAAPTWTTVSSGLTLGTPVAALSGTAVTFTGIPAGTKQIIFSFSQVSSTGTSVKLLRLGTSAGIETTGYTAGSTSIIDTTVNSISTPTSGILINSILAAEGFSGSIILTLMDSSINLWAATGVLGETSNFRGTILVGGRKALSGVCDRISLTTSGGTDTFDSFGSVNIAYA
jgi:hypothetical protein